MKLYLNKNDIMKPQIPQGKDSVYLVNVITRVQDEKRWCDESQCILWENALHQTKENVKTVDCKTNTSVVNRFVKKRITNSGKGRDPVQFLSRFFCTPCHACLTYEYIFIT